MNKIKFVMAICGALLLASCSNENEAKKAVLEELKTEVAIGELKTGSVHAKDPEAVKFGKFTQIGKQTACFTINASKFKGNNEGELQACMVKHNGKWHVPYFLGGSHEDCVKFMRVHNVNGKAERNTVELEAKLAVFRELIKGSTPVKYPDSVKFEKFTLLDEETACLSFNPSKLTGSIDGYQQATLKKYTKDWGNQWAVLHVEEGSHKACVKHAQVLTVKGAAEYKAKKDAVEYAAKKAVLGRLKDPDSAKFGDVCYYDETQACIAVNARNSFGGYTGEQMALLKKIDGVWQVLDISNNAYYSCAAIARETDAKQRAD